MKRFHVHVSVEDLEASIRFYTTVFGAEPTVRKPDYAKWMVEDPRVNFALSRRGAPPGLDHLGFQVDSDDELAALRARVAEAEIAALDQRGAECCYARGDKYWTTDPQGIAWETFRSLDSIPVFGADSRRAGGGTAREAAAAECCTPGSPPEPALLSLQRPVRPAR
jgi:catechol 2,3-dioxygenase-like lactoylglutathione lyase family enzyme